MSAVLYKGSVAASLLLVVHATLCAIQRAPPLPPPRPAHVQTGGVVWRRSGLSEGCAAAILDAARRGALPPRDPHGPTWTHLSNGSPIFSHTDCDPVLGRRADWHLGHPRAQGQLRADPDDGGPRKAVRLSQPDLPPSADPTDVGYLGTAPQVHGFAAAQHRLPALQHTGGQVTGRRAPT